MEDKNSQINIYEQPLIQNENNNCDYNYVYDGGCINCGEKKVLMGDVLLCGSIYVKKNGILEIRPGTNIYIKNASIGYNNPIRYVKSPLVSGYISKENAKSIENSRPFVTTRSGKGRVSVFTDNTNFRAFWY